MTKSLANFTIVPDGESYRLQFALDDGSIAEVLASFAQLDQLAEEIDRQLDADEDTDSDLDERLPN